MEKRFVREIRKLDDTQRQFEDKSRARPSGLVYDPRVDQFLYLRESSGNATTTVLDAVTAYEDRDLSRSVTLPTGIESLNTTFDARFNRFLGLSRNGNTLILVQSDANSKLDTSTQTEVDIRSFGIKNARGFTTAPDGTLYVLDGAEKAIIVLKPDARGNFEQSNISQVALPSEVGNNLRGIAFDATTGNLHVLSIPKQELFELTPKGEVVAVRDLSPFKFGKPESLVFGFSGDNTDDPNELSLYVADSERGVTELSFEQPVRPQVSASLPFVQSIRVVAPVAAEPPLLEADAFVSSFVQRTDTSQWSPPSPDPSGVTFDSASGNLVLDDGEVNEVAIFQGVNVWEFTTSGTVVDTGNTLDFPTGGVEPTGISYNPANGHFFFSNDLSGDVITETDGNGASGDVPGGVVNQFNSSSGGSGSTDSEGVAFADLPGGPFLFIAGGINGEVYQFTLSGTLVNQFDTAGDGFTDPEGIVYDSVTGNLFITGGDPVVGEYTTTGTLVNTYDISTSPTIDRPAGIVIAPSSQGGGGRSFYIVDRGEDSDAGNIQNDGQVHEFLFDTPPPPTGADLSLTTTVDNATPVVDDDVTFTVTVTNDGPDPTTNVSVTDALPAGLTFLSDTASQGTYNSTTGVWDVGTLANGGNATLTLVADTPTIGTFTNTAEVTASDEADPDSTPGNGNAAEDDQDSIAITVAPVGGINVFEGRVSADDDDAEELSGSVDTGSSDLELVFDDGNQTVGMRVGGVNIPQGATITSAYIQFTVDEVTTGATNLTIVGEDVDNAQSFAETTNNISSRATTTASVAWNPAPWTTTGAAGVDQRTADMTAIIQEIVNRPGWSSGNAIATIITGTGERTAESFKGNPNAAPLLHIEYAITPPTGADLSLTTAVNNATVGVGDDVTFTLTLTNDGPDPTTNVAVTNALPAGLTFLSDTPSQGSYNSTTGVWTVGALASGSTVTLDLVADTPTAGTFTNTAEVTASDESDPDSTPGNGNAAEDDQDSVDVTVALPGADLSLTTAVDNAAPGVGDDVTFTLTLTNDGPDPTTNVAITDALPAGLTFLSDTASQGSYNSTTGVWDVGTLANSSNATLTLVADTPTTGMFTYTAEVTASDLPDPDSTVNNNVAAEDDQDSVDIAVGLTPTIFETRIASGNDDAEEATDGGVSLSSSDLEFVFDRGSDQVVGMRHVGVNIPQGSTITNAYIQFQVDEVNTGAANLTIRGQADDDPLIFSDTDFDISSRPTTTASVAWNPVDWTTKGAAGVDQRTADMTAIIQEIVDRPGWSSGNAIATIITGTGERTAESFDGLSAAAPLLHVEWV